jgi:serine/threonine protein kinase
LSARALQAGAAVAAAYGHVIGRDEAAAIVARAEAEGADDSETSDGLPAGTVVADRFALGRVLGSGGFGVVYEAVDMADPRRTRVAIKMEKGVHRVRSLRHEATVFEALKGGPGVPPVLWSGSVSVGDGQRADILVMPLLGDSLYDSMRKRRRGHFSPQTVMSIARRVLRYLEHMHARGWLHRDIKPHNFLLDRSRANLFIIDFGLAKRWCDPRTGTHIDYERRSNRSSVPGTAKYASLNTHEGVGAPSAPQKTFSLPFLFFPPFSFGALGRAPPALFSRIKGGGGPPRTFLFFPSRQDTGARDGRKRRGKRKKRERMRGKIFNVPSFPVVLFSVVQCRAGATTSRRWPTRSCRWPRARSHGTMYRARTRPSGARASASPRARRTPSRSFARACPRALRAFWPTRGRSILLRRPTMATAAPSLPRHPHARERKVHHDEPKK